MANDKVAGRHNTAAPSNKNCAEADGNLPPHPRMRVLAQVYAMLANELNTWQANHNNDPQPAHSSDTPVIWQLHDLVDQHRNAQDEQTKEQLRLQMDQVITNNNGPNDFKWSKQEVENLEHLMLYEWSRELAPYDVPADVGYPKFW